MRSPIHGLPSAPAQPLTVVCRARPGRWARHSAHNTKVHEVFAACSFVFLAVCLGFFGGTGVVWFLFKGFGWKGLYGFCLRVLELE